MDNHEVIQLHILFVSSVLVGRLFVEQLTGLLIFDVHAEHFVPFRYFLTGNINVRERLRF